MLANRASRSDKPIRVVSMPTILEFIWVTSMATLFTEVCTPVMAFIMLVSVSVIPLRASCMADTMVLKASVSSAMPSTVSLMLSAFSSMETSRSVLDCAYASFTASPATTSSDSRTAVVVLLFIGAKSGIFYLRA